MNLLLSRHLSDDHGTVGTLCAGNRVICLIGELPWRDNRSNISSIPAGRYRVNYLQRSASGRYRDVYHVRDVPNRAGILIHVGNYTGDRDRGLRTDSHGCLLPGLRLGHLRQQRAVLASRGGLDALHAVTGRQDFTLTIEEVTA
jgi:hypothetical protein